MKPRIPDSEWVCFGCEETIADGAERYRGNYCRGCYQHRDNKRRRDQRQAEGRTGYRCKVTEREFQKLAQRLTHRPLTTVSGHKVTRYV